MAPNFILLNTTTGKLVAYPRLDDQPVEGLDARYEVLAIVRTPQPEHDPTTHSIREIQTIDRAAGQWIWSWLVEPLPTPPPVPDWRTFKRTLLAHPAINQMLAGSLSTAPAAGLSLPPALLLVAAAGEGDPDDFRGAWIAMRRQGLVSSELLQEVRGLALALHLPDSFVAALGGAARPLAMAVGQEWVDASGDPWVVVQARDAEGQFLPDDPSTIERESLVWERQE
jgi:hypothetical protein